MNLKILLKEMEIKKQFNGVARFKSGELTYKVKMLKKKVDVSMDSGKFKTLDAIYPDFAITLLSSRKRDGEVDREISGVERPYQTKVRDGINKAYNRMYKSLSSEEVEKFGTKDAILKLLDTIRSYFNKYDTKYIVLHAYKDNKLKRERLYSLFLKKLGYFKLASTEDNAWHLYGKNNEKIKEIIKVSDKQSSSTRPENKISRAVKTLKKVSSNL